MGPLFTFFFTSGSGSSQLPSGTPIDTTPLNRRAAIAVDHARTGAITVDLSGRSAALRM